MTVESHGQTHYPDWVHRTVGLTGLALATIVVVLIIRKLAVILQAQRNSL